MAKTTTATQKVQEYKDTLKTKAEDLILNGFPEKIVKLNELLETSLFVPLDLGSVHQKLNIPIPDPVHINSNSDHAASKKRKLDNAKSENEVNEVDVGTKVMLLTSGPVPCNSKLTELIGIVKPHIKELVADSNLLKMWVSFMIPKIEDGNNFGVSIQEDTLAEIQSVESEAAAFFDQISRYYVSRAKLISKVAKYPHIEDYRRSVQEMDEKEYLSLWLVLCEVRNRYSTLHDIVTKNIDKIKKPRSTNSVSLY
ncbi:proteasome activator complex subunit 3 [Thrips palmi]|uniref:Proteasome activator complex subunit 3 n=1 Tax=Thrips palmi TaxID=161013 RepID=A0A6P8Z0W6_THRPL|nr:proteasome activator complex subunit 3 [Thrips palmi]